MATAAAEIPATNAITAEDVFAAAHILKGQVVRTPALYSPKLSQLMGTEIFIKYENLQATGSFKDRGALVKLLSLSEEERQRGVVTMSAGNHAQAVAWHAKQLGIRATIVMPSTTPYVKVGNTEALGARVILCGATISEAQIMAENLAAQGLTLVHPFDDPHIIAGQGTAGLEFLKDQPDIDCLIIPIGGGGLASGIALAAKAIKPGIELIGVETVLYPSAHAALKGAEPVCGGHTLAEGIAVKSVGKLTLPILREHLTGVMLVEEVFIEHAVFALLSLQKIVAEGAGAAALAAIFTEPERFAGRKVGLVLTGGNIDPRILASIIFRGLERENKIVSLRLTVPDQPGMLGKIATALGSAGANILDVSHRRMFLDVPAKGTSIDVLIETKGPGHASDIVAGLQAEGFDVVRLEGPGGRELEGAEAEFEKLPVITQEG